MTHRTKRIHERIKFRNTVSRVVDHMAPLADRVRAELMAPPIAVYVPPPGVPRWYMRGPLYLQMVGRGIRPAKGAGE